MLAGPEPAVTGTRDAAHIGFMRTLDKQYLATHPAGDEKAEFTLAATTPEGMLPLNPDGTRPQITVKVVAGTYSAALGTLSHLHDNCNQIIGAWAQTLLTPKQIAKAQRLASRGEKPDFAQEAVDRIHPEFIVFETTAVATVEAGAKTFEQEVELTITAPSASSGVKAFHFLTSPENLNALAVNFSPVLNDGEYGLEEDAVLVR